MAMDDIFLLHFLKMENAFDIIRHFNIQVPQSEMRSAPRVQEAQQQPHQLSSRSIKSLLGRGDCEYGARIIDKQLSLSTSQPLKHSHTPRCCMDDDDISLFVIMATEWHAVRAGRATSAPMNISLSVIISSSCPALFASRPWFYQVASQTVGGVGGDNVYPNTAGLIACCERAWGVAIDNKPTAYQSPRTIVSYRRATCAGSNYLIKLFNYESVRNNLRLATKLLLLNKRYYTKFIVTVPNTHDHMDMCICAHDDDDDNIHLASGDMLHLLLLHRIAFSAAALATMQFLLPKCYQIADANTTARYIAKTLKELMDKESAHADKNDKKAYYNDRIELTEAHVAANGIMLNNNANNNITPNNISSKLIGIVNVNKLRGALVLIPNNVMVIPVFDIPVIKNIMPTVQGKDNPPNFSFKPSTYNAVIIEYAFTKHMNNMLATARIQIHATNAINDVANNEIPLDEYQIAKYFQRANQMQNELNETDRKLTANQPTTFTFEQLVRQYKTSSVRERQLTRPLRLCGGGESSLNVGTSGWGSPPSNSNNNAGTSSWGANSAPGANAPSWNNNAGRNNNATGSVNNADSSANKNPNVQNQGPTSQPGGNWSQNGNKQSQHGNNNPSATTTNNNPGAGPTVGVAPPQPSNSTKSQLEQLTSLREALYSLDGWGGQHVNQDTHWEIPSSPEPAPKGDGTAPVWKPPVNNGTDLWESNLRNGGQPPPQPVQKAPWGHTPTTNIGGTWGEDDDVTDSSNVWTGVPNAGQPPSQWNVGGNAAVGPNNPNAGWGAPAGPKKENDWNAAAAVTGPTKPGVPPGGWGADPRGGPPGPIDVREVTMRASLDPRAAGDGRDPRMMLPDMRAADPRVMSGGSGRLTGEIWNLNPQPPPHHLPPHHQPPGKMPGAAPNGLNQWPGAPPKDLSKPSGWGDEQSPPSQRRNVPTNYDDGTSLWGNPNRPGNGGPGAAVSKPSHWTDMPSANNLGVTNPSAAARNGVCPPGIVGAGARKPPDASGFGRGNASNWGDDISHPNWSGGAGVAAAAVGLNDDWNKPKTPGWGADANVDMDWHKKGPSAVNLTKDVIWSSRQFKYLVEMGYKKEDVENALRARDMNAEDALDLLGSTRNIGPDGWRSGNGGFPGGPGGRHDEPSGYDHLTGMSGNSAYQRFNPPGPFPPTNGNTPNLMNALTNNNNNSSIPLSPSLANVQKMLAAAAAGGNGSMTGGNNGAGSGNGAGLGQGFGSAPGNNINQLIGNGANGGMVNNPNRNNPQMSQQPLQHQVPSTQQLRMLVQQIQMAVNSGFLNHQILNQPLAPQTLLLLNQLLQHIKLLQQLIQQSNMLQQQNPLSKNSSVFLQLSVQITKTRQQIQNLQNQIAANQALYIKQHAGNNSGGSNNGPNDFFKMTDPIATLQSNFADLAMNKDVMQGSSFANQPVSRLNQWIKSDKDDVTGVEFSRAPGTVTKSTPSHTSPMNLGLGQSDGPWSSGRTETGGGWPDPTCDVHDATKDVGWPPTPSPAYDLVPEFEPGKPWKGNQMKNIEDDPTITPGSVVRSPLSVPLIKEDGLFGAMSASASTTSKVSPTGDAPLGLSSNTWSFNPTTSSGSYTSPLGKIPKGTWDAAQPSAINSELWASAPMNKTRGPPPGLAKGTTLNGWNQLGNGANSGRSGSSWSTGNWGSQWLLLKNLTTQIDGSTLQTLCKQHGPLLSFHLYLNHGYALAKYSSREEAIKAQTALNNCVLSNTTILAESPSEQEANTFIQNFAPQSGNATGNNSGANWRTGGGNNKSDTWTGSGGNAGGWSTSTGGAGGLWGAAGANSLDNDAQRATPSNLNSFLPGDLLGGESM